MYIYLQIVQKNVRRGSGGRDCDIKVRGTSAPHMLHTFIALILIRTAPGDGQLQLQCSHKWVQKTALSGLRLGQQG